MKKYLKLSTLLLFFALSSNHSCYQEEEKQTGFGFKTNSVIIK